MPVASLLSSVAAFTAQSLYGSWHWRLIRLRREHLEIPIWLNWTVIDNLHLAAMVLALCSLVTGILALMRGPWWAGLPAFAIALCVGWYSLLIA
ncbi:MAG: hypothetical protein ACE149_17145 [Armatimonadota bacterium]